MEPCRNASNICDLGEIVNANGIRRATELQGELGTLRDSIPVDVDQFVNPIDPRDRIHDSQVMNEHPEMRFFHLLNQHIIKVAVIPEQYRTDFFEALIDVTKKLTYGDARAEALELLAMQLKYLAPDDVVIQAHALVVEISKINFEGHQEFNGYTHASKRSIDSKNSHVKDLKDKVAKQVVFELQTFKQADTVDAIKSLRQVIEIMFDIPADGRLVPSFR